VGLARGLSTGLTKSVADRVKRFDERAQHRLQAKFTASIETNTRIARLAEVLVPAMNRRKMRPGPR
jgi:hypothetical protein